MNTSPSRMPVVLLAAAAIAAVVSSGCSDRPPITTCEQQGDIEPVCDFQNPEDLALLPDGRTLVVSQFGAMDGSAPGNLAVFDTATREKKVVFGGGGDASPAAGWGDPACPGPPGNDLAPHGLDLSQRADGRLQLLLVNHGGREAIEFFEVLPAGLETRIEWRGCAVPPDDSYLNDVVATPQGGLLTTHMMPKSSEGSSMLKATLFGSDSGSVLAWHADDGWSKVEGTDAPFPNGLALSADGRTLFVNVYLGNEVRRVDLASGETTGRVDVAQPDNVTWSSDGSTLLVASHVGSARDSMACMRPIEGSCPMPFEIVAVDPEAMTRKTLAQNAGPPMGAATVAVQVGPDLWLGTFSGDRVARVIGGSKELSP